MKLNELSKRDGFYETPEKTVESYLNHLCKYGKPTLSKVDKGWHCWLKMFISGEGISFDIRTSFKETSAFNAVSKCYELMNKALDDLR